MHGSETEATGATPLPWVALGEKADRTSLAACPASTRQSCYSWAFSQLRQFLAYKAQAAGAILHLVSAAYTSQMCHICLHIGSRAGKRFTCSNLVCGWTGDADLNEARNIRTLGLQVSQARGPWLHCPLDATAGLLKTHAL